MIRPQSLQIDGHKILLDMKRSDQDMAVLAQDSFTAMCDDQPVCCAGFVEIWSGRGSVWSVFDRDVTHNIFLSIHRQVCQAIDAYQPKIFRRLELTVKDGFRQAHRWARSLGFEREGHMRKYDHYGNNYTLYSRIR